MKITKVASAVEVDIHAVSAPVNAPLASAEPVTRTRNRAQNGEYIFIVSTYLKKYSDRWSLSGAGGNWAFAGGN